MLLTVWCNNESCMYAILFGLTFGQLIDQQKINMLFFKTIGKQIWMNTKITTKPMLIN